VFISKHALYLNILISLPHTTTKEKKYLKIKKREATRAEAIGFSAKETSESGRRSCRESHKYYCTTFYDR